MTCRPDAGHLIWIDFDLPFAGEILISHVGSIDNPRPPVRYAGAYFTAETVRQGRWGYAEFTNVWTIAIEFAEDGGVAG